MADKQSLLQRIVRLGRKRNEPPRETEVYPRLIQLGQIRDSKKKPSFKPVARNLRYFSRTPYARRAINSIKNPVAQLEWEIVPKRDVPESSELKRQIETATYCFDHPNSDDSFRTLIEQVVEDYLSGAGAIEVQVGGDPLRPLWMWPVDGLSIQIYAGWDGSPNMPRYFQANGYGGLGNLSTAGIQLRNDELIYLKPNPTSADPFGVGPLEIAFMSISRQLGVAEFAGNVASNARPSIGIHLKNADDRLLNAFRAYWRNEIEGQGQTPMMGGEEFDVKRLFPDGDKALYLEWQQFLIREIAVAFDLSPMNLGIERDVNRNTGEVSEDRDWASAIRPCAANIGEYLTREALHRKLGYSQLEFRWVGITREDEQAAAAIAKTYYEANVWTPNDIRSRLGEPPAKGQWGDLNYIDTEIAKMAARGVADVESDSLPDKGPSKAKTAAGKTNKGAAQQGE